MMMPEESFWNFKLLLVLCFLCKTIHLVDLLHTQTQHDIFFIDWEQVTACKRVCDRLLRGVTVYRIFIDWGQAPSTVEPWA